MIRNDLPLVSRKSIAKGLIADHAVLVADTNELDFKQIALILKEVAQELESEI